MNTIGNFEWPSQKGWECPRCHAVMSPTFPTCFYCKPDKKKIPEIDKDFK